MIAWHAAIDAIVTHPLFSVGITLTGYQLAVVLYERTRWVLFQPVLVAVLIVIGLLLLCGLDYHRYRENVSVLSILLGPATVALAVPLYLYLKQIRRLLWPTVFTLVAGGLSATVSGIGLGWLFGIDGSLLMSLAPKSVTTPIAMLVAEEIGGVQALAAVFVMITGILGAVMGPELLRRCGVRHPAAQGLTLGIHAHAVGTYRALQENEECGAFSALAMSLMGIATAILLPLAIAGWS